MMSFLEGHLSISSFEQNTMPMGSLDNDIKMAWYWVVIGWIPGNEKHSPCSL